MTKAELVDAVATKADLTKKDAEAALNGFIEVIKETLAKGDDVTMVGFGTFGVTDRAARTGKNPQTGEVIKIAAKKAPKFKAGKGLKDAVEPPKKAVTVAKAKKK